MKRGQIMLGSSPLARGLRGERHHSHQGHGIIPARAGFTCGCGTASYSPRDHPRSRGVYSSATASSTPTRGSSPLARGLHRPGLADPAPARIIPARAGFTPGSRAGGSSTRDHPRSRGVYRRVAARSAARSGSSPLARGLLARERARERVLGIIPARAGFTIRGVAGEESLADHPRSRGVYVGGARRDREVRGSSPLARGLQTSPTEKNSWNGIIPARAGFTSPGDISGRRDPDHPRSRGVYVSPRRSRQVLNGSSPLARGLRFLPRGL